MHFGAFLEFTIRQSAGPDQAFQEGFRLVDLCESVGLDSVWLAEFHFTPERSVLSSPVVTASAIAMRTKRVRIGLAVYVLPLSNPLRIAEEIATLDQLSNGRLEFGIGRSGFARSYNSYAVDYAESQDRFDEALLILQKAFRGERFSFDGVHYQVNDALVVPQPVQRPSPPMRMAASSAATFEKVARLGLPLFIGRFAAMAWSRFEITSQTIDVFCARVVIRHAEREASFCASRCSPRAPNPRRWSSLSVNRSCFILHAKPA